LYKATNENCIPFHKFYKFLKHEIKKCDEKIYAKANYSKSKYETVQYIKFYKILIILGTQLYFY
jgi:hypothetical protein